MTKSEINKPTRGQLERSLSQQIQKLYREALGHSPSKVTCQLRDDQLTVVIDSSLTQPEQLLLQGYDTERVEQLRSDLDNLVRPKLTAIVEATLGQEVVDLMSDTTLETERTGLVIVLKDHFHPSKSDGDSLKVVRAS